jgi:hypothetical protein
VRPVAGRFEMLLSTSPNLFGEPHFPPQGLWLSTAATPSGDVRDWSTPRPVVDAAYGPEWVRNGFFGSSHCAEPDAAPSGTRHVFFTAVHDSISWPKVAMRRLAALRRPPVPAPFYFTIGRITVEFGASVALYE